MSSILSQEEINALLMGVMEDQSASASSNSEDEGGHVSKPTVMEEFQHVTKYDFRRPNKFSKDLLRILKGFHDNMARLLSASLSVYLRQDVKVHLTYIEQHTYHEYIEDCSEKSLYYITSFIDDQALLSLDVNIALLLVEKILGGQGTAINVERLDPTEIELTIIRNILDKLFQHQKESWGDVMKDLPRIITVESNPRVIHLVQPNDIVLKMVFEIVIADSVGIFTYCIPYIAIDHVMNTLLKSQFVRMQHQYVKKSDEMQDNLANALVDLTAELGHTEATVMDLLNIEVGDVIPLLTKRNQDLLIKVGGIHKFGGEIGISDKRYALKINRIYFTT